ncbi:MAG: hypothetical protein ACK5LO_13625 [Leucobacter sp.]
MSNLVYGPRGSRARGPVKTWRSDHSEAILALDAEDIPRNVVAARGTVRRLRALVALGYSETRLANELGMNVGNLSRIILMRHLYRGKVLAATAERVDTLYERLHMAPNTGSGADSAKRIAKKHRWAPPLAWDDIDHDAHPNRREQQSTWKDSLDHAAIDIVLTGGKARLSYASRLEVVRILEARETSTREIADRLGSDPETVRRMRRELVEAGSS